MECSQLKRNRRTEGDATNDGLIDFQVIEKRLCIRSEASNRKPFGIAKFRSTVTTALQGDAADTG
jgi:hypothetical protein